MAQKLRRFTQWTTNHVSRGVSKTINIASNLRAPVVVVVLLVAVFKIMFENKLQYAERLTLRDRICSFRVDDMDEKENFKLQGQMLFRLGFDSYDSKYPSDTWVGVLRLKGWQEENDSMTEWAKGRVQKLYNS